jgi:hypothetical protein
MGTEFLSTEQESNFRAFGRVPVNRVNVHMSLYHFVVVA